MRLSKRHGTKLDINMTPMIDVTFLLLIFFMTVNQMSKANQEPLDLPKLAGTQDQSDGSLTVNVDAEGMIVVGGNPVTLLELATIAAAELAKVGDPARMTVVLRADRRGNCRTVNQVVALLVRLEIHRVRIAVESPA